MNKVIPHASWPVITEHMPQRAFMPIGACEADGDIHEFEVDPFEPWGVHSCVKCKLILDDHQLHWRNLSHPIIENGFSAQWLQIHNPLNGWTIQLTEMFSHRFYLIKPMRSGIGFRILGDPGYEWSQRKWYLYHLLTDLQTNLFRSAMTNASEKLLRAFRPEAIEWLTHDQLVLDCTENPINGAHKYGERWERCVHCWRRVSPNRPTKEVYNVI